MKKEIKNIKIMTKNIKCISMEDNQCTTKIYPKKTLAIERRISKSPFPGQSAGAHCLGPKNKRE